MSVFRHNDSYGRADDSESRSGERWCRIRGSPVQWACRTYAESTSPRESYYDVSKHVAHALYIVHTRSSNPLSNVPSQCQGPAHYLAHHQPSARRVAVRAGRYPAPWRSCASAKAPASTGKAAGGPTSTCHTMNLKRRRTSTGTVAVLLWSRDERSALGRETRRSAG